MSEGIRRAVILARGLGTRMRRQDAASDLDAAQVATADSGLKAMIPIDRPFMDYLLSAFADAGYKKVCLVVGPEHDSIRRYYRELSPPQRIEVSFAIQEKALGTADALLAAESQVGGEEFVVTNSDNYYPVEVLHTLRTLGEPGAVLFEHDGLVRNSNIPKDRIRAFAYGVVGAEGYLEDLVEKPDASHAAQLRGRALVSMNCWRLPAAIFDACRRVPISSRGEYELPMAILHAIRFGMKLKIVPSCLGVLDLSYRADIPEVARRLKGVAVSL